jgi:hypothetical protein
MHSIFATTQTFQNRSALFHALRVGASGGDLAPDRLLLDLVFFGATCADHRALFEAPQRSTALGYGYHSAIGKHRLTGLRLNSWFNFVSSRESRLVIKYVFVFLPVLCAAPVKPLRLVRIPYGLATI